MDDLDISGHQSGEQTRQATLRVTWGGSRVHHVASGLSPLHPRDYSKPPHIPRHLLGERREKRETCETLGILPKPKPNKNLLYLEKTAPEHGNGLILEGWSNLVSCMPVGWVLSEQTRAFPQSSVLDSESRVSTFVTLLPCMNVSFLGRKRLMWTRGPGRQMLRYSFCTCRNQGPTMIRLIQGQKAAGQHTHSRS